jgi:hypothetical protein
MKKSYFVGVIGHRELEQEQQEFLFYEIVKQLESIPDPNKTVLTSLSPGADTLGAMAALHLEIPFLAILPSDIDTYLSEFSQPERDHFHEYLNQSDQVILVKPSKKDVNIYQSAARYLLNSCDSVIVLWDKRSTKLFPGGTFDSLSKVKANHIPVHIIPCSRTLNI